MTMPNPDRLRGLIQTLEAGLLERDAASRLALLAALAGEHVLLIGPPGTAKSELARRLHRLFEGAPYFERLLTRFSTPEELFGPLSLKALEDDRYERLIDGFLPTAGIAFLDEVFKANSAILNALLTLLNEREFDNGSGRLTTPLVCVLAASNEVPVDDTLQAFYDRFLIRVPVQPVSDGAFTQLLTLALPNEPGASTQANPSKSSLEQALSSTERNAIAVAASAVELSADAITACTALRQWLQAQKFLVSDRRWRQWVGLMRTAAATEGRARVDAMDLWTAPYAVSPRPDDAPRIAAWFTAVLLQAVPQDAVWLTRAVEAFEKQLEIEETAAVDGDDAEGAGKLALARAIGRGDENEAMLRIVSQQLEDSLRRRYSPVHLAARLAQLDEVLGSTRAAAQQLAAEHSRLQSLLAARLWMPPSLQQELLGAHTTSLAQLQALLARLERCRAGFAALPVDTQASDPGPPAPVDLPAVA
jgi:MoxR-like ATPase